MDNKTIAFIGGGNMAQSLIGGITGSDCDPSDIWVADPYVDQLDTVRHRFKVNVTQENTEAANHADIIVLAVKPQVMKQACERIADSVQERKPLVISIAAGINEPDIRRWLGGDVAVVRAMPNTPALVKSGATVLFANERVTEEEGEIAEHILRAVGMVLWVNDETQMDAVTATSGSGPAYFFLTIELIANAATEIGLPEEKARMLALQTAYGASKMALESEDDPATLRDKVTSPGGTTAAALEVFENAGMKDIFVRALTAARDRGRELSAEFGKD